MTNMSNMIPHVSTLDLLIAISSTVLNSKEAIASPCLKPSLTLNSKDKYLPILTLAYISVFKIPHSLTSFFLKPS